MRLLQSIAGGDGVPLVGSQPVMVSSPGSPGAEMPKGTQELTLSRYRLCSHTKHETEAGLFSYDMGVYVRQKAGGDDSHVIDHIHNQFHLPCIYYLPLSPAL